jgi:colanic acid/amylovoran biosynthesis glycosyltransferase
LCQLSPSQSKRLPESNLHLAYVTTGYPYVSHTFILNEVLALRGLGVEVETFALRREPRSECRTAADRDAWETTYTLRPPKYADYLRAHGRAALSRPRLYARALALAVRMGVRARVDIARHFAYFVQAVVLWDRCRRAGITHIHAHFANVASDVALLAALLGGGGFSWSFTMHGPTEFYDVTGHRLAEKAENAALVICISDFARSQLMALISPRHWDKLRVVRCGVDVNRFAPASGPAAPGPRISCVGRLVPEKGQALLIDAVAKMRNEGLPARLCLVGDGPERAELEAQARLRGIAEHVVFLGAVSHSEVEAVLRDSDIFCLPSFAEGVPIVLMEAMAMEKAVVASAVMGIPELIEDGVTGRLIRPGSFAGLFAVLVELARDAELRGRLGSAARQKVKTEYELQSNAKRLKDQYEDLLDVKPG